MTAVAHTKLIPMHEQAQATNRECTQAGVHECMVFNARISRSEGTKEFNHDCHGRTDMDEDHDGQTMTRLGVDTSQQTTTAHRRLAATATEREARGTNAKKQQSSAIEAAITYWTLMTEARQEVRVCGRVTESPGSRDE